MLTQPWYTPYLIGLQVSWTSNTSLTVAPGLVTADEESTTLYGTQLINVGVDPVLDCTAPGVNGVQGGELDASSKYDVYAIQNVSRPDSGAVYAVKSGETFSFPDGYNLKQRIFTFTTDVSGNIRKGCQTGNGVDRTWVYDSPVGVLLGGGATSYTEIDLGNYLPEIGLNMKVMIRGSFTPNASGDLMTFAHEDAASGTGEGFISGYEATKTAVLAVGVTASADMKILYKVSAGLGDAALIGYVDSLM